MNATASAAGPLQPMAPVSNAPSGAVPPELVDGSSPLATPHRQIHLIGNAHLDPVWLWPWQEGYQEARATFWSAIHRMEEYPDFVFTCDQIVLLSWVKEQDPDLFAAIQQRVDEGRWVNVGGWWVEPDCNLPMGESFVRQGLFGQRFLIENFAKPATVGMNCDPFGHHGMIPAILRGQGMDCYTFLRPGPHEAVLPRRPFWWRAPDGSQVLACRIPHEYCSPRGDVSGQIEKGIGQLSPDLDLQMVFYGVGNHGGGPTKANIDSIHRYQRMGTFGRLTMTSPREYFDEVAARLNDSSDCEVWTADLQHHAPGCYSANSAMKQWMRRAQWAVLAAERWAVIASTVGQHTNSALGDPERELHRAWQQVLFNQFHDILPGSAIREAYDDARDQLGEATAIGKRITTLSHNAIARQIDLPMDVDTQPVVVFNHHPWPVTTEVVVNYGGAPQGVRAIDDDGAVVATQAVQPSATTSDASRGAVVFTAELPALGYAVYRLANGPELVGTAQVGTALAVTETSLENDYLRVVIDPHTGWLSSLLHKESGLDLVAGSTGDHLVVCQDPTDTWGHRVVSYAWPGTQPPVSSVRLVESGPVRARIRVERRWGQSRIVEDFVLGAQADALRLEVSLDWREQAHLLKMRVPVAISTPKATVEIPFAVHQRDVDGAEHPGQSWVDLTGRKGRRTAGLALVTDAKHGYDAHPGDDVTSPSIAITALRSPVFAWHDPKLLDEDAVYNFQDQGLHQFTCLLVPHTGGWAEGQLSRRAAELGLAPRAQLESFHQGVLPLRASFVGAESVTVTAVKAAEDDPADVIVRAVESSGSSTRGRIDLPVLGASIEADFGPYQIRTFRLSADGQRVSEVDLIERDLASTDPVALDTIQPTARFQAGPLTM